MRARRGAAANRLAVDDGPRAAFRSGSRRAATAVRLAGVGRAFVAAAGVEAAVAGAAAF